MGRRWLGAVCAVMMVGGLVVPFAGAQSTPGPDATPAAVGTPAAVPQLFDPMPVGGQRFALRTFRSTVNDPVGEDLYTFGVVVFGTDTQAFQGMEPVLASFRAWAWAGSDSTTQFGVTAFPMSADGRLAYRGSRTYPDHDDSFALVAVRDRNSVFVFYRSGGVGDVSTDLLPYATIIPRGKSGDLFSRLPALRAMPPGYELVDEQQGLAD